MIRYLLSLGHTTTAGDGEVESTEIFADRDAALAAARAAVPDLRMHKRFGWSIIDEVMVEEIDADGEPIDQPIFWVRADGEVVS